MGIVLDANNVDSYVLPNLVNSKNSMMDAYSTSVTLKSSLPVNFEYRGIVSDVVGQISDVQKEIDTASSIISKKMQIAKKIESKSDSGTSAIALEAVKISSIVNYVSEAVTGSSSDTTGAISGTTLGKAIEKTYETGAQIMTSGVSLVKNIGMPFIEIYKKTASKVKSGVKSANYTSEKNKPVTGWIASKFNSFKNRASNLIKNTGAFFSNLGGKVTSGVSKAWNWAKNGIKKVGASIANAYVSFTKGVVHLVESIGDIAIILGTGIGTIKTALYDVVSGAVTGGVNWKATKGLWESTKSVVSCEWTNKLSDMFYATKAGKTLDEYAFTPFKSDGIGCKIIDGVGYVAGIVALTVATFGVGGVAIGSASGVSATTMAVTATTAGVGKYTEEEWNKNKVSVNYQGTDMDIAINYEKYSEIEKLKQGESTIINHQITLEDGSVQELTFKITAMGNGKYKTTDLSGNVVSLNNIEESSTLKGLAVGGVKGAWEGIQWYVGGKIGTGQFTSITSKISNQVLQTAARSGIRVGLDIGTGAVEVPFQSLVTMFSEGKSWKEAWKSQGGWDAVIAQAAVAGITSLGGEALDFKKTLNNKNISDIIDDFTEDIDLEDELAFFNCMGKHSNDAYPVRSAVDLSITPTQKRTIDQINSLIQQGYSGLCITYNSTSEISSSMLAQIDDLSKVNIRVLDGLGDSNGALKLKYLGKKKYENRVTYNGYEMKAILERIENLQSKINVNLPVEQRAKQIYELLSTEVPVMRDYWQYEDGHLVAASLRGLTSYNTLGKEGLVCAGYASVYKELCDRVGIKCDYVRGIGITDPLRNGKGGGHAWNVVYTDKGMIPVDVTWKASSDGTKSWFGTSEEFAQLHIPDADEFAKDYSTMISSIMFESPQAKLKNVLDVLYDKYGNRQEVINRLEKYLNTHDSTQITRTSNARDIVLSLDDASIMDCLYQVAYKNKIANAIYVMDQKQGINGYGIRVLENYLNTGNFNLITRTNGARDTIISLGKTNIQRYLSEIRGY